MPEIYAMEVKSEVDKGRPVVSVVTVARNCRDVIEATVSSVLSQDYPYVEYLVVDGASNDGTADIIGKFSDRLAYFVSEPDGGIYDAMNKAVSHATGEYVIFMNAGDTFASNDAFSKLVSLSGGCDVVYGDIRSGRAGEWSDPKVASEPGNYHRIWFCHQAAMARRCLLEKFPFDKRYKLSADYNFFKRCFKEGCSFRHVNFVVAHFDKTGASNKGRLKGLKEDLAIVMEQDHGKEKLKFSMKLGFQIFMVRLRKLVRGH